MLNLKKNKLMEPIQEYQLFYSAKACFVMSRISLELSMDFNVPGFMLMQQTIENLIKAHLKKNHIQWSGGNKGHDFIKLLENRSPQISFFDDKILNRQDFCVLLNQLHEGYTAQRYGEGGHYLLNHEKIMDLFDEMVFILIEEFGKQSGQYGDRLNRFVALPIPIAFEERFKRKLKQQFIFSVAFEIEMYT